MIELKGIQKTARKMTRSWESKSQEERLKELGMLNLEKGRLRGDMVTAFKYLEGCHKEDGKQLLPLADEGMVRSSGFKLQEGSG